MLNRLPVVGSRDHEGSISPPLSHAKENHSKPETLSLRRVLSNHDSGLTDLSFDFASPLPERSVYVCGASHDTSLFHRGNHLTCNSSTIKERIITALSSRFYVRSSHCKEQCDERRSKISNVISNCDTFVLILGDGILEDASALSEILLAKLYNKVIVSIREPGFTFDSNAREKVTLAAEKVFDLGSHITFNRTEFNRHDRLNNDEDTDDTKLDVLVSRQCKRGEPLELKDGRCTPALSLVDTIGQLSKEASIYAPNSHEESIGKLFYKLSDSDEDRVYLPPLIESTPSSTCEDMAMHSKDQAQSEIALAVPPPQQNLSRVSSGYCSSPSPQPIHLGSQFGQFEENKHEQPMEAEVPNRSDSKESPSQLETSGVHVSSGELVSPTTTSSSSSPTCSLNTSACSSPVSAHLYRQNRSTSSEMLSHWLMNTDFETPTFLETNYLVYPFNPDGPKVKPYLFRFPLDLRNSEKERRDSFSTDVSLFHSNKTDDFTMKDSLELTPLTSPVPPSDGIPTVSEMKLMNNIPKLPPGVTPKDKYDRPIKQHSLPLLKTGALSTTPLGGEKLPSLPKRSSSVDRNLLSKSSRQIRERKYLKLSTVRLEYSKSR
ncbi:hypothetical protein HOLleu_07582 [Holothuria leucospilota]|uniref:Uncharacterized protein n=1 Tax=Holothuria leucospilota TaxID=206669 RepID=A0A9Q1HFQ3_HOLLE|nr:hypothetical protein HOLleu_07582 [Holothuria leucospilota]